MQRPNVILLTIDTLRRDMLGCYGNVQVRTPYLDQLAKDGILFSNAITSGSWTQAAFPPIITSTYASMYGGCEGPLSSSRPSPVTALSEAGYTTAAFSTSPLLSTAYEYHRGFDHFEELIPEKKQVWLRNVKGGQKLLRSEKVQALIAALFGKPLPPNPVYLSADHIIDSFTKWQASIPEPPFFAWLHTMDVHWPYHLQDQLNTPTAVAQAWDDLAHLHAFNWSGAEMTEAQRLRYVELYQKSIERMDQYVGQLVEKLQTAGTLDNTIILVLSDHGEELLEHGRWGHFENNLFDEVLRIPMILHIPGQAGGTIVDEQVSTMSIMPTLLDLCGVPAITGMLGSSLTPLWQPGKNYSASEFVHTEMWRSHWHRIAVRSKDFKLIWDSKKDIPVELFDLQEDAQERKNLAEAHPDIVAKMQRQVDELLERMNTTGVDSPQSKVSIDGRMAERLRDLGYLE